MIKFIQQLKYLDFLNKIKQLIKNIKELKTENLFKPRVAIILILNTSVPRNCISEGMIKKSRDKRLSLVKDLSSILKDNIKRKR